MYVCMNAGYLKSIIMNNINELIGCTVAKVITNIVYAVVVANILHLLILPL